MAQLEDASCQCFSPGSKNTMPPGWTVSTGPPSALHPAKTGDDEQGLSKGVGVPSRPRAGLEAAGQK